MSIATRAAACTSCGKRLNRKQWYYRNGKYFCKKRCWVKESEKTAKEAAEKSAAAQAAKDKEQAATKAGTPPAGGVADGSAEGRSPRPKAAEKPEAAKEAPAAS